MDILKIIEDYREKEESIKKSQDEQKALIMAMFEAGYSVHEISEYLGISERLLTIRIFEDIKTKGYDFKIVKENN